MNTISIDLIGQQMFTSLEASGILKSIAWVLLIRRSGFDRRLLLENSPKQKRHDVAGAGREANKKPSLTKSINTEQQTITTNDSQSKPTSFPLGRPILY
jgi:hypothetical protein